MLLTIYLIGLSVFYILRLACDWKSERKRSFKRSINADDNSSPKKKSAFSKRVLSQLQLTSDFSCPIIVLVGVHIVSLGASIVCGLNQLMAVALSVLIPSIVVYSSLSYNRKQRRAFANQVEPLLTGIANSLYGNPAIINAVREAKESSDQPMRDELSRALTEIDHGRDIASALGRFSSRIDDEIISLAVDGILICRETGGNLSSLLESLSSVARTRTNLEGKIKAMTAQQKTSARFVAVTPIMFILFSQAFSPTYQENLSTPIGIAVTTYAFVSVSVGFIWLNRMTDILQIGQRR